MSKYRDLEFIFHVLMVNTSFDGEQYWDSFEQSKFCNDEMSDLDCAQALETFILNREDSIKMCVSIEEIKTDISHYNKKELMALAEFCILLATTKKSV